MTEPIIINAPPPLWVNEFGHLLGFGSRDWNVRRGPTQKAPAIYASTEFYPCTEVIEKWVTNRDGEEGTVPTIDLRPYKYVGHPRLGLVV